MFEGTTNNKVVAAILAAGAASSAGAGADSAAYLAAYKDMLLGLDKLDDQIAQERAAEGMRRLNERRASGMVA